MADIIKPVIGDLLIYSIQLARDTLVRQVAGIVVDKNDFGYKVYWQNNNFASLSGESWIHYTDIDIGKYIVYKC